MPAACSSQNADCWLPSTSVKPYSRASSGVVKTRPDFASTFASAASAAIAPPAKGRVGRDLVAAPGVVDEQVEPPLLSADSVEERLDLRIVGVVTADGDAGAAAHGQLFGGLVDRARTSQRRRLTADAATGDVDDCSARAQHERDALAAAAARSCDERDFSFEHPRLVARTSRGPRGRRAGAPAAACAHLSRARGEVPADGRSTAGLHAADHRGSSRRRRPLAASLGAAPLRLVRRGDERRLCVESRLGLLRRLLRPVAGFLA